MKQWNLNPQKLAKWAQAHTLLLSSLATLLPIPVGLLLSSRLPAEFAIHWNADGIADGTGSLPFAIFVPPLLMLAVHLLCIFVTRRDPGNKDQNKKAVSLVMWIIPIVSNLCCYMTYALAMGANYSITAFYQLFLGLLFVVIGNYLPKCRTNATIGIKVPWVYTSRHNWNATHRFGGICWMVGGLVMMLAAFIPNDAGETIIGIALAALILAPTLFSLFYYLKQKANGDRLRPLPKLGKSGIAVLAVVAVLVGILMFTGKLEYSFQEDALTIKASYYSDFVVPYDAIESLELREDPIESARVGGFGSARLLMGFFHNEEFETFTRYTYFNPDACIILTLEDRTLVISGKNMAETQALYDTLLEKVN